jgi:chromosome segregation ATPase
MKTRNFADVIRAKLAADPDLKAAVEIEKELADVEQQAYDQRAAFSKGATMSEPTRNADTLTDEIRTELAEKLVETERQLAEAKAALESYRRDFEYFEKRPRVLQDEVIELQAALDEAKAALAQKQGKIIEQDEEVWQLLRSLEVKQAQSDEKDAAIERLRTALDREREAFTKSQADLYESQTDLENEKAARLRAEQERDKALAETIRLSEELDSLDCAADDEQCAHQETLLMLAKEKEARLRAEASCVMMRKAIESATKERHCAFCREVSKVYGHEPDCEGVAALSTDTGACLAAVVEDLQGMIQIVPKHGPEGCEKVDCEAARQWISYIVGISRRLVDAMEIRDVP